MVKVYILSIADDGGCTLKTVTVPETRFGYTHRTFYAVKSISASDSVGFECASRLIG